MSKVTGKPHCSILEFLAHAGKCRPVAVKPSSVDRQAAAKLIHLPRNGRAASITARPNNGESIVKKFLGEPFSHIKGEVRQEMIARISEQLGQDPYLGRLLNKVS